jgi:hypothetical protein
MQRRVEPTLKLQAYLPAELKHEVERQAAALGQPISTFVARALAAAVISIKAKEAAQ